MGAIETLIIVVVGVLASILFPNFLGIQMSVLFGYIIGLAIIGMVAHKDTQAATFATVVFIYLFVVKIIVPMFMYAIFPGIPEIGDIIVNLTGNTFVVLALSAAFCAKLIIENEKIQWIIWVDTIILVFLTYAHSNPVINAYLSPLYWYFNIGMLLLFLTFMTLIMTAIDWLTSGEGIMS